MRLIDAQSPETVCAFTDGSCYLGDRTGGWAFWCSYKGKSSFRFGPGSLTTNNEMELTAVLRCLQFIPCGEDHDYPFVIYTDSKYALNAVTRWVHGWRDDNWKTSSGLEVKNREVIEECDRLVRLHDRYRDFALKWVRGHSGIEGNEFCDQQASHARKSGTTNWRAGDLRNHRKQNEVVPC